MNPTHEQGDNYTVVIFRGSTAKPLRFNFPRKFIQKALIVGLCFLVADLIVVSHYVIRTGECLSFPHLDPKPSRPEPKRAPFPLLWRISSGA